MYTDLKVTRETFYKMMSLYVLGIAILVVFMPSGLETSQPREVYDHHSYGYILRYWDTVDIFNVKAHFTFLIRLPKHAIKPA